LGFSHLETLHHAFKRWTGQTPGEYRRRIGFPVDGPQASQHSTVRELRAVTAPKLLVARDDEEE
jgi:AraC-like DNA-binding protein